jgi:hypothetical protein
MKLLILTVSICFMMVSCGSSKNAALEEVSEVISETVEQIRIVGTVRLSDTGCKVYIDAKENDGSTFKLYPENLDANFQKEGMFLKFYYDKTTTELPENCEADMSATLREVTPLRQ